MNVLQVVNKGTFFNNLLYFCIYEEAYDSNKLKDKSVLNCNRIFEPQFKVNTTVRRTPALPPLPIILSSGSAVRQALHNYHLTLYTVYCVVCLHTK